MRTDLLRWGGIFCVLLAVLFTIVLALGFAMGVDIYTDSDDKLAEMLLDIDDNQVAFASWAILGMTTPLLLLPALLGLFSATRKDDRPYFALSAAFFGLAAVFGIIGYGATLILPEVADNYSNAEGTTRDALLHDGEMLQSLFLLLEAASFSSFGLGMLSTGILSLRSGFFPRWLAWPTIVVGVIGAAPVIGFIAIVPGRILWLLISGAFMLRRARTGDARTTAAARPSALPA